MWLRPNPLALKEKSTLRGCSDRKVLLGRNALNFLHMNERTVSRSGEMLLVLFCRETQCGKPPVQVQQWEGALIKTWLLSETSSSISSQLISTSACHRYRSCWGHVCHMMRWIALSMCVFGLCFRGWVTECKVTLHTGIFLVQLQWSEMAENQQSKTSRVKVRRWSQSLKIKEQRLISKLNILLWRSTVTEGEIHCWRVWDTIYTLMTASVGLYAAVRHKLYPISMLQTKSIQFALYDFHNILFLQLVYKKLMYFSIL